MDRNGVDYYTLLGIDRSASGDEIGRAYRRAARATHPDIHPDEPAAGERFTAIAIAYETLSDPARRASYDRAQPAAAPAYGVEPVGSRRATPFVVPIRIAHRSAPAPIRLLSGSEAVGDDPLQLAVSLSRLLHWTWRSF
jgi:curved DNA-binding protein CbpA